MMKLINAVEYLFLTAGVVLAVSDVKDILCIILLIIDGLWLLLKFIFKLFKYAKDGEFSDEELEDLESEINKKNGKY